MTQPTITTVPAVPKGTPAILIKVVAAVLGVAGPLFAWLDPGNHLPHGAIQACVILAFLAVAAAIFLTHVILGAVHEYGWSMNAVTHVDTEAEAELKTLLPQVRAVYEQAQPVLAQIPDVGAVTARVAELEQKVSGQASSPALADVVAAVRADLGFAPKTGVTVAAVPGPVPAPGDPAAVTGQAS
jgi:hypothetical protein